MQELFSNVEHAIAQYEYACQQEEGLYDLMRDAERDMQIYNAQAASSEDGSAQMAALEKMRSAALQYKQYESQLQQVQNSKNQALGYLQATRMELLKVIKTIEEKLPKFDQSISVFEQMASNPFGSSASAQLPQLRATRAQYQQNLDEAYVLIDKIDGALNGGGNAPQKVLRR